MSYKSTLSNIVKTYGISLKFISFVSFSANCPEKTEQSCVQIHLQLTVSNKIQNKYTEHLFLTRVMIPTKPFKFEQKSSKDDIDNAF